MKKRIVIKKWRDFQHYKSRTPPWIKLHTRLLADPDFRDLPDSSKLTVILLWLLVAREGQEDGSIEDWRVTRKSLGMLSKLNLQPLLDSGFIWYSDASNPASNSLCISVSLNMNKDTPEKTELNDVDPEPENKKGFEHVQWVIRRNRRREEAARIAASN